MRSILKALDRAYPKAACSLAHTSPLELLVATILSAQCTDVLVNQVTPTLFARYPKATDYANAPLAELEKTLARVNFYRNKARFIQETCRILVKRHGTLVPQTMEALLELPGVARKTANVVLGNAFGIPKGVVVDTHVMRISRRLGLSNEEDPDAIEQDLVKLLPKKRWVRFSHQIILHGRTVCQARRMRCAECPLGKELCPSYTATDTATETNAKIQKQR